MNRLNFVIAVLIVAGGMFYTPLAIGQTLAQESIEESASSSLLANTWSEALSGNAGNPESPPHALRSMSLFAVAPSEPRTFVLHDLVQIIVRETSQAKSSQELETEKETKLDGAIPRWPDFRLEDLLNLQIDAGRTTDTPELQLEFTKEFNGEGDYQRKDDLTARLTAEVIEVLPNGNLVLEARTNIQTDEEAASMKVTGICQPDDVSAANTILSNQIHDLTIEKMHKGELNKTAKKGLLTKMFETVFAF